ncbi:hypothetical protein C0J45_3472 [Silurus meridionalis]|nr:hypothetical protein C0J45_3472 [Silurus meridionalis]
MVNGDQLPPPYNPTCPQPYAQEARNAGEAGISTVTQCSNNVGTSDVLPPEYTQCFEDVNCFSEASVRRGFIKKVYLTLMIQLLITVGIICAFLYWFFRAEAVLWAVGATALVSFSLSVFAMQSKYLVMDTQLMLGGKHKYTISAEEYIFASLNLYLDIVTIFLLILQMIGLCR